MEFRAWEPEYERILRGFGFSRTEDRASADLLRAALREHPGSVAAAEAARELRRRLKGKDALIIGGAGGALPLPEVAAHVGPGAWVVIAADGATTDCLQQGTVPAVIVTDLDGRVEDEVEANRRGAFVLAHAHGDNAPALRAWVPRFPGPIAGSCASEPDAALLNPGGFTDGDRCVFVAEAFGARRAVLAGFDFGAPRGKSGARAEVKRRKLRVAEGLIAQVARRGRLPVLQIGEDGALRPFEAAAEPPPRGQG